MTYLLKTYRGHPPREVDKADLKVRFQTRTRDTGRTIAGMRLIESDGYDRSYLSIDIGLGTIYGCDNTREGVNAKLRSLRDDDAEILRTIDEQIAELRMHRRTALSKAWTRAHKVPVGSLRDQIRST